MVHAKPKQMNRSQHAGAGWKALVLVGCVAAMGIGAAAGQTCTDFTPGEFKKTVLASGLDQPMKMAVAKDGRVFFNQRSGAMRMLKPGSTTPVTVRNFVVANGSGNEDGLLGFALDPKFESNQFMYMFYTPTSPMGYRISRFTLVGDSLNNEKILLTIPHLYPEYGPLIIHGAGAMAFDPSGNLLVTTGDLMITNGTGAPTPTDQNSSTYDAQKTSANTNSYLGKVLRIKPTDDGGYTIPEGNLFAKGTDKTLPEIYAMGLRNPFTMTVDPKTGNVYVGEVGPDGAGGAIPSQDEVNQIKAPGNFGWPYLTGDNQAYPGFSADKLTNNSKNNTGIADLPAPIKSLFWMGTAKSSPIAGFIPKSGSIGARCIKVGGLLPVQSVRGECEPFAALFR